MDRRRRCRCVLLGVFLVLIQLGTPLSTHASSGSKKEPTRVEKSVPPRTSPASLADADFLPSGLRASVPSGAAPGAQKPLPPNVHPLGLLLAPPSKPPSASAILKQTLAKRGAKEAEYPSSHDNSAGLPPIGDQGAQGSCVSWATGYYMKSYQEGREHGWPLGDPAHQFSPRFLYNQLHAFDEGSTFEGNLDLLLEQGCASMADEPYDDGDYLTYPTADSYRTAIPFRAQDYAYLGNGETWDIFDAVKTLSAAGELVAVGIPVYRPDPYTPGRFDLLTQGDSHYEMPAAEDVFLAGFHAVTIVGYDETAFSGQGAYRIVNSWGDTWGDAGFAWLSEAFLTTFGLDFYTMTDRIAYQPTGMVHYKVSHS